MLAPLTIGSQIPSVRENGRKLWAEMATVIEVISPTAYVLQYRDGTTILTRDSE